MIDCLIIIVLQILNGIFSMYELAIVSASKPRMEILASEGNPRAKAVLKELKDPNEVLSVIQIGITLISIISGAFGGVAIADNVQVYIAQIHSLAPYAHNIAMVLTVSAITYFSLIVGELMPKLIALSNPEHYAMMYSPFMRAVTWISYPLVWFLSFSTHICSKLLHIKNEERPMSQEEIRHMLTESSRQGVIDKEETDMLRDVFRFSDKKALELMTHRTDLQILHPDDTKADILNTLKKGNVSKYLLIDEDADKVLGVVSVKDLILEITSNKELNLPALAKPVLYIPENQSSKKVLESFKKHKTNFGVVVNEYGDVEGIVTFRDLAESIFGDIINTEDEEPEIVHRKDGTMLIDGDMNVGDFMDEMGIFNYDDIKSEDFTTLNGLAMFLIGRMPKTGDCFTYRNLHFEVVDTDAGVVDKLLVSKEPEKDEAQ